MTVPSRMPPVTGGDNADRLARVAAMVTDAVALLNSAMKEIKGEREPDGEDDDRNDAGPPDRDLEQRG